MLVQRHSHRYYITSFSQTIHTYRSSTTPSLMLIFQMCKSQCSSHLVYNIKSSFILNLFIACSSCIYNSTRNPLTAVPMVSLTVLPNCPCLYRWFLWVWCHCMTSFREKVLCKIAQLPIGQFLFTLVSHMTCCYFAWLWLVNLGHMTLLKCHCSFQLNCLHQVVLLS